MDWECSWYLWRMGWVRVATLIFAGLVRVCVRQRQAISDKKSIMVLKNKNPDNSLNYRDFHRLGLSIVVCTIAPNWWRRRELNPRPPVRCHWIYMFRSVY